MTTLQVRRGTAADATSNNPVLAEGEIGYETDTGKFKIGDGSTAWSSLTYFEPGAGGGGGGGLDNVVEDTTPQLGGSLDTNGQTITDAVDGIVVVDDALDVQGDITVTGTVDGRDVAADGTKLDFLTVTQAVDLDQIETDVAALANGMTYRGNWDASAGSFPSGADTGAFYTVSVGGTVDSIVFDAGDRLVAIVDSASTTVYAANWTKLDATDAVTSVDGQTGSVDLSSTYQPLGDYVSSTDVTDIVQVTQAAYDLLTPDADTLYVIVG